MEVYRELLVILSLPGKSLITIPSNPHLPFRIGSLQSMTRIIITCFIISMNE